MAEQWYCQLDGEQVGPIDSAQLQGLARRGRLTPETLVRTASGKNWVPASKVNGLKFVAPVTESAPSSAAPAKVAPVATAPVAASPVAATPAAETTTPAPTVSATKPASKNAAQQPGPATTPARNPSTATMRAPASLKKAKLLEPGVSPGQVQQSNVPEPPPLPMGQPVGYYPEGYVPPPPPAFAPSLIPSGVPVGTPVGTPYYQPDPGYAPPPAAEPPPPWIQVDTAPQPTAATTRATSDQPAPLNKKQAARRKLYLMVGGVGGVLAILVVVGVVLALSGSKQNAGDQQVAKKSLDEEFAEATSDETASDANGAKKSGPETGDAVENAASENRKAAAAKPDAAARRGADKNAPDLASAMKSVARWFDMSKSSAVTSPSMKLQVIGVWLEDAAKKSGGGDESGDAAGSRVFIELRITNTQAESPLNYTPWNGDGVGGGKSVALLASDGASACQFVPVSMTKDVTRHQAPVRLKPGQSLNEVLVFAVPEKDFEMLQLVLPTTAIGQAGRSLGLKIPHDLVAAQKPVELADDPLPPRTVNANARETPGTGGAPKIIAADDPLPAKPAPAEAPKMREETIDDLRKSITDSVKERQKEKDEAVAKEREANKKKPE